MGADADGRKKEYLITDLGRETVQAELARISDLKNLASSIVKKGY